MAAPKKRREAERELKKQGFGGRGSHEVWQNKDGKPIVVPTHGDEIAAGIWRSIQRQTGQPDRIFPGLRGHGERAAAGARGCRPPWAVAGPRISRPGPAVRKEVERLPPRPRRKLTQPARGRGGGPRTLLIGR
ncbi:type II toxin-antitoxin system HicA family toxin [Kribbella turkmenica]|uniref:Type II toxin-antitoxin system HicA family toxin n=1 Tax=Kribbella turkmenica TaxID=2530375 RepID=A0A4V2YDU3_9ACTN|nr:type II toxin-antitoxin system HicA family toxin [Kribbella turkmenica]